MTLPNFFIVGAARSGTTTLWSALRQHPDVFMPWNKEPNFYVFRDRPLPLNGPASRRSIYSLLYSHSISEPATYECLFHKAQSESAVGEASVRYLYYPHAAACIHEAHPEARIIMVLRNPVDRAYSHYCMNVAYGIETLGFREAIAAENGRIDADWGWDWHYVNVSLYYKAVRRFIELFGSEQVRVYLYDDFCIDPAGMVRDICSYLGIDSSFDLDTSQRLKESLWPRFRGFNCLLNFVLRKFRRSVSGDDGVDGLVKMVPRWNRAPVPRIAVRVREELLGQFEKDVLQLESLLLRDLTAWRT